MFTHTWPFVEVQLDPRPSLHLPHPPPSTHTDTPGHTPGHPPATHTLPNTHMHTPNPQLAAPTCRTGGRSPTPPGSSNSRQQQRQQAAAAAAWPADLGVWPGRLAASGPHHHHPFTQPHLRVDTLTPPLCASQPQAIMSSGGRRGGGGQT